MQMIVNWNAGKPKESGAYKVLLSDKETIYTVYLIKNKWFQDIGTHGKIHLAEIDWLDIPYWAKEEDFKYIEE